MNGLISSCRLLTPDLWRNKKPLIRAAFYLSLSRINLDNHEVLGYVMDGEASTSSLTQSDEYVRE